MSAEQVAAVETTKSGLLSILDLSKTYSGTRALDRVSLALEQGEIRALLGQNGSGKSTLVKILAGVERQDSGEVMLHSEAVRPGVSGAELRRHGIGFVHQDLGLVGEMSVLENLRVGRYETGFGGRIMWRSERALASQLLNRFEVRVDPRTPVNRLTPTEQVIVAIVRAVQDVEASHGHGILVLDEPTAALPAHEVDALFDVVRGVAASGSSVLFITHNLDEVLRVADSVSVLRDGRLVATHQRSEVSESRLIELIVGRSIEDRYPPRAPHAGSVAMSVRHLTGRSVGDMSFSLRQGEIVGLTGLAGAGHDEVPYLIVGASTPESGVVSLPGHEATRLTPHESVEMGVMLLPADRQRASAIPRASVRENVTLPVLVRYRARLGLQHARERADVAETLGVCDVRPPDPERPLFTLSGGNQQKALLGRLLRLNPPVLLLHEPTQGVDVGARRRIFGMLRDSVAAGASVLYVSLEYEDLANICDRVLILRRGKLASELRSDELNRDRILAACYGTGADSPNDT